MDIRPINNYQPQFSGSVDKSVRKYIKRAIQNECSIQFKNGTYDPVKTFELEDYGNKILKNLSQYMAKTDKNTKFTLGNTSFNNFPRFKNPITSHLVRIYSPLVEGEVRMDEFGEIAMPKTPTLNAIKDARDIDLIKLERYYNKLRNINPKEIDKAFYNAEKEIMDGISEKDLGFFAGIKRIFKEAKLESFLAKINEKNN